MADYQRIVEFIRDIRSSPVQSVSDELRQYAAEYADLCKHANERLRQCSAFLQQGLRSEAIHLAEDPPNLLDLVAALDLPDAEAWADTCQQFDLPVPQALQLERAAQLNEAYNQDQSLDELLRRHRLMALSRAPVKKRLDAMRQIAAVDGGSAFWEKDIRMFEHARIREMRRACAAAVRNEDAGTISELAAEIEQNQWFEPIPPDLQQAVSGAFQSMLRAEIEVGLQAPLQRLRQAFAAKDHAQCAQLLQEVRQRFEGANQTAMSTGIAAELQPIAVWVQQQNQVKARRDEFAGACRLFASALAADAPQSQLDASYAQLRDSGAPMPPELEDRYKRLKADRQRALARKHYTTIGVLAGVVVVALVGVGAVLHSMAARDSAREIRAAVAARDLPSVQRLVAAQEKRHHSYGFWGSMVEARKEAAQLQNEFDLAAQEIKACVDAVGKKRDAIAGTLANEAASTEELGAASDSAGAEIANLDSAAKALNWADTAGSLHRLRDNLDGLRSDIQKRLGGRISGAVKTELASLTQRLESLPAAPTGADLDAALGTLADIAAKAKALAARAGIDNETRETATGLTSRVDQKRQSLDQARSKFAEMQAIRLKASSADDLQKALESYVSRYPAEPISKDFAAAAKIAAIGKSVETWRSMVLGWGDKLAPPSAKDATARVEAVQAYLTANPRSPMLPFANLYLNYLKTAGEAMAEQGTWQVAMNPILKHPSISEFSYMESSEGKRYYTWGDIKRKEAGAGAKLQVTFEAIDPADNTFKARRVVAVTAPLKLVTPQPVPLPHTKVCAELADQLKLMDESSWDKWGLDALDRVLKHEDIDPVVKAIFVQAILKANDQVNGWALGNASEKALKDLAKVQPDAIIWYDSDRPITEVTRDAIKKAIASIPKIPDLRRTLDNRKAQLFKEIAFAYAGTGVLMRNETGTWSIYAASDPPADTIAWAVGPVSPTPPEVSSLVPVGQFKNGKWTWEETGLKDLPEGTIVFMGRP